VIKRPRNSGRPEDIPRDAFAFETLRFFIPTTVAEAIDVERVITRATAAGFTEVPLEISDKMSPSPTMKRVVCPRFVAAFLVEEITDLSQRAKGDLRRKASEASMVALLAIASLI
jgi:hypothetical protein